MNYKVEKLAIDRYLQELEKEMAHPPELDDVTPYHLALYHELSQIIFKNLKKELTSEVHEEIVKFSFKHKTQLPPNIKIQKVLTHEELDKIVEPVSRLLNRLFPVWHYGWVVRIELGKSFPIHKHHNIKNYLTNLTHNLSFKNKVKPPYFELPIIFQFWPKAQSYLLAKGQKLLEQDVMQETIAHKSYSQPQKKPPL